MDSVADQGVGEEGHAPPGRARGGQELGLVEPALREARRVEGDRDQPVRPVRRRGRQDARARLGQEPPERRRQGGAAAELQRVDRLPHFDRTGKSSVA